MPAVAHRVAAPRPQPAPRPNPMPRPLAGSILAIGSGKGGVGKTWLSITLASLWGRAGKRTLLIDGDFGLANIDVQLGVRPQADLAAVVRGWIDADAAVTPVLGGHGRGGGFDLLPGHSGSGALAGLRPEEADRIIHAIPEMARHYDRVIIDLPAGVDPITMRLAACADRALVIVTEEPTALTDGYAFVKLLRQRTPEANPMIAVNIAERRPSGRKVYEQLARASEAYLGFRPPLAGIISRDPHVPDSIRAQTPLIVRSPGCTAADEVRRIADTLAI